MKTIKMNQFHTILSILLILPFIGCAQQSADTPGTDANDETYFEVITEGLELHNSEEFDFYVQPVVDGLDIAWGMAFLPDGNILITERRGTLRLVEDGQLKDEPISNTPEVFAQGQGGLLDVQLHPDYEENGWIYLSFSKPGSGGAQTAVIRAKLDEYSLTDIEEIYTATPFSGTRHHFGSRIVFDREGYLYFSVGDRGASKKAQEINSTNGSVVRLHDDGRIPESNPFLNQDGLDEIYSFGHRNIQGMTVHPETGVVWSHEHGPRGGDEINFIKKGANYGWPEITYGINYDGSVITEETEKEGMEQPVYQYTPSIAPSGMDFITGNRYPGWEGNLINGALRFQLLSRVVLDDTVFVSEERLVQDIGRIRDVQMGPDGWLYFSNESDGTIYRIIPSN